MNPQMSNLFLEQKTENRKQSRLTRLSCHFIQWFHWIFTIATAKIILTPKISFLRSWRLRGITELNLDISIIAFTIHGGGWRTHIFIAPAKVFTVISVHKSLGDLLLQVWRMECGLEKLIINFQWADIEWSLHITKSIVALRINIEFL